MRTLEDDDDEVGAKGTDATGTTQQPAWMRILLSNCNEWLAVLPSVRVPVFFEANPYAYYS